MGKDTENKKGFTPLEKSRPEVAEATRFLRGRSLTGFTLIEALLYIGLFSVIITSGLVGAFQIIQSTDRTSSKNILEQDASFILRKTDWALTGAILLETPSPQPQLQITRNPDFVNLTLSGGDFIQQTGTLPAVPLNSSRIKISDLSFQLVTVGGKQGVVVSFTATTLDSQISQEFSMTKYLR